MPGYQSDKKLKNGNGNGGGGTLNLPDGAAVKGDTGATGPQGEQGEQGERGLPGSGTFRQVEVDFGSTSVNDKKFTITDAGVTVNSIITAQKAIKSPSNGRDIDEIIVEEIEVMAQPKAGSVDLHIYSKKGNVSGKFIINYIIG